MKSHFFAYMARMKWIKRWGLRRNTQEENDQEHSLQVAMIAHALAIFRNGRYGGGVDVGRVLELAVYHEAPEVITGDLASPIKYFNAGIKHAFQDIEHMASRQLLGYLPEDFQARFESILFPDTQSAEWRLVKAADKISAYVKCVEELGFGNDEFVRAEASIRAEIEALQMPEVNDFMEIFVPSFSLPLDALN